MLFGITSAFPLARPAFAVRRFGVETEQFEEPPAAKNELDPEVQRVLDDILKLNLVQVNQMVTELKVSLPFLFHLVQICLHFTYITDTVIMTFIICCIQLSSCVPPLCYNYI